MVIFLKGLRGKLWSNIQIMGKLGGGWGGVGSRVDCGGVQSGGGAVGGVIRLSF